MYKQRLKDGLKTKRFQLESHQVQNVWLLSHLLNFVHVYKALKKIFKLFFLSSKHYVEQSVNSNLFSFFTQV